MGHQQPCGAGHVPTLCTWGAPSSLGDVGEGAGQGGGPGAQARMGWDVIAEHSPSLEQAGRGLPAAAAFPGVFFLLKSKVKHGTG